MCINVVKVDMSMRPLRPRASHRRLPGRREALRTPAWRPNNSNTYHYY